VRVALWAGGGLDLAAALTSHDTVNTSAKAAGAAPTTVVMLALICAPGDVGEVFCRCRGRPRPGGVCRRGVWLRGSVFCAVGWRRP